MFFLHCKYITVEADQYNLNLNCWDFFNEDSRAELVSGQIITKLYSYFVTDVDPEEKWQKYLTSQNFLEKKKLLENYYQEFSTKKVLSINF